MRYSDACIYKVGEYMKILLVNKFHYRRGGSETYYFALAEALQKAGHKVIYFAMESLQNEECEQKNFFVTNVDYVGDKSIFKKFSQACSLVYSFEAKKKFESLIKSEKPDVVHMNLVHRQITLSIVDVCQKYNIPVVFTTHDLVCCCPVGSMLNPKYETCRKCYGGNYFNCTKSKCIKNSMAMSFAAFVEASFYRFHKSYDKIGAFITPSYFYKKEIEKSKITKSPIYHMANLLPWDTEYLCEGKKQKYFLFLGSLTKNKGVYTLLRAFHKANIPDWKLVYAGTGEEFNRMQVYIEENSLENRVELLGFVTGSKLKEVTKNAFAVVLPSEWYENGPYALMEPMACGKPIIGAEIGGIPELAIPGKTGWLFESGNVDALAETLISASSINETEYMKLSKGACEFACENFNARKYIQRLEKIYMSIRR